MENLPQSFSSLRSSQSKKPSQKLSEGTHCPELHRRPTHSVTAKKLRKNYVLKVQTEVNHKQYLILVEWYTISKLKL